MLLFLPGGSGQEVTAMPPSHSLEGQVWWKWEDEGGMERVQISEAVRKTQTWWRRQQQQQKFDEKDTDQEEKQSSRVFSSFIVVWRYRNSKVIKSEFDRRAAGALQI